jgi:putative lipoprotein
MKKHALYTALAGLTFAFAITSCQCEEKTIVQSKTTTDLKLSTDTVSLSVGDSTNLDILSGDGDYKAFSENPDIVAVELIKDKISIRSKEKGKTAVVVSDATGRFKRIPILSRYGRLSLSATELSAVNKIGTKKEVKVDIKGGNGGYKAESENPDIAKISSVSESEIRIILQNAGTTKVIVADMMGLTQVINVKVETTDVAYTADEIEALKNSDKKIITWDDDSWSPSNGGSYSYFAKETTGKVTIGWEQKWGSYVYGSLKITYDGDLTVGKKNNVSLDDNSSYNENKYTLTTFEIVKNDGTNVWAIYSVIKDGTLHYGHLCLALTK